MRYSHTGIAAVQDFRAARDAARQARVQLGAPFVLGTPFIKGAFFDMGAGSD